MKISQIKNTAEYQTKDETPNDTFLIKDFWNLKLTEFLYKYDSFIPNIQNSKIDIPSNDEQFIDVPSDYREIYRYWYLLVDEKDIKLDYIRKNLFLNGIIRRLINPQITFGNMLHNIIWEYVTHIADDRTKITKDTIFHIVKDVMNADLSKYSTLGKTTRKTMENPYFSTNYNKHTITSKNKR